MLNFKRISLNGSYPGRFRKGVLPALIYALSEAPQGVSNHATFFSFSRNHATFFSFSRNHATFFFIFTQSRKNFFGFHVKFYFDIYFGPRWNPCITCAKCHPWKNLLAPGCANVLGSKYLLRQHAPIKMSLVNIQIIQIISLPYFTHHGRIKILK